VSCKKRKETGFTCNKGPLLHVNSCHTDESTSLVRNIVEREKRPVSRVTKGVMCRRDVCDMSKEMCVLCERDLCHVKRDLCHC